MWTFGLNKTVYHGHDAFYLPDKGREACTLSHKILISVEHIIIKNAVVIVSRGCASVTLSHES